LSAGICRIRLPRAEVISFYRHPANLNRHIAFDSPANRTGTEKCAGLTSPSFSVPVRLAGESESDMSIQVCRMAVKTNYFPLWEAEYGKFRLDNNCS